jgi:hypothetical protein
MDKSRDQIFPFPPEYSILIGLIEVNIT